MTGLPRSVADALHSVTHSQRALAYLQIDEELKLIGAGGNLENYAWARFGSARMPSTRRCWKACCHCPRSRQL